jgi:hypothetical protein
MTRFDQTPPSMRLRLRLPAALALVLVLAGCSSTTRVTSAHSPGSRHQGVWWSYPPLSSVQYTPSRPGDRAVSSSHPNALTATDYPASIYPPPARVANPLRCPSATGLQRFSSAARSTARSAMERFGSRGLSEDLHDSDRAWWPQVLLDWQGGSSGKSNHDAPVRILYTGALMSPYPSARLGAPNLASQILAGCGRRVANDSYVIVNGSRTRPALHGAEFFLNRHGHVLLYFEY